MTLQESRPVSDPLLALQQFEQAFAQARQLLIDTQTFRRHMRAISACV